MPGLPLLSHFWCNTYFIVGPILKIPTYSLAHKVKDPCSTCHTIVNSVEEKWVSLIYFDLEYIYGTVLRRVPPSKPISVNGLRSIALYMLFVL